MGRMTCHCFQRPIRRHLTSSSYTTAAWKRSHQWCVSLTPNNTNTMGRMTCHCFQRPIRRHLTSSSYTTAAWKRSHQWCVSLTPNNTNTMGRMTCHCFQRPIRRHLTSSSYATGRRSAHTTVRKSRGSFPGGVGYLIDTLFISWVGWVGYSLLING